MIKTGTVGLLLGALLVARTPAFAQATVSVPPLGTANRVVLPTVSQSTLPNGLRLVVIEDHRQPEVYMRLTVAGGIGQEPTGKAGLATVTVGMITAQSTTQSVEQIGDKVDAAGAHFRGSAALDDTSLSIYGVSTHADAFCDLLADLVKHPFFDANRLAGYKQFAPSAMESELSNPAALASIAINRILSGTSAYGNIPYGTPDTFNTLTLEDVMAFYQSHYTPATAILFVVGDINDTTTRAMALKSFGDWTPKVLVAGMPKPAAPARASDPASSASVKPTITILDRPGAQQTEIRIGAKTTGYRDPQRIAGDLATAVLGGGEFENRLTQEIRVKRGLTYGVASAFERHRDSGEFLIQTYTKNASTGEVIRLALAETAKIASTPPTPEEIADHKSYLKGNFAVSLASINGLLGNLIEAILYGEGPEDLSHFGSQVDAVTAAQVSRIIADLHIESAQIVLVGDAKIIQPQVSDIGTVTVIEPDQLDLMSPTLRKGSGG